MRAPFVVKLEIERMAEEIMVAINPAQIALDVEASVKKAVDTFDFDREVEIETHRLIRKCVSEIIQRRMIHDVEFARNLAACIDEAVDASFSLAWNKKGGAK